MLAVTTCRPAAHRAQHVVERGLGAADQLDDQVAALEEVVEVAAAAGEHARDLRAPADLLLDRVGPLLEQLVEGRADGAVTEQPDPEGSGASGVTERQVLVGLAPDDRRGRRRPCRRSTGGRGTAL